MALIPSTLPAFESHGGRLQAFNDGHCPETFRFQQHENGKVDENSPQIVRYDCPQESSTNSSTPISSSSNVHVYDGVLNSSNACMLYDVTSTGGQSKQPTDANQNGISMALEGESPWGTYVTIQEALEWIEWNEGYEQSESCDNGSESYEKCLAAWREKIIQFYKWQHEHSSRTNPDEKKEERTESEIDSCLQHRLDNMDNVRHALAVEAVAKFFVETVPSTSGTTAVASKGPPNKSSKQTLFKASQLLKQAHGVAVWALSSNPGHSVQYHIDYAELLRYEYNVTVPPLWAGTIQCSALWNSQNMKNSNQTIMRGGEFCVNLRGLEHYAEHGYKGNLSGDPTGGWRRLDPTNSSNVDAINGGVHINDADQWVTIPYAFNRGIVHRGDLPHLSAPVDSIGASGLSRVIVGFNVFGHDVGALIAKAPEHSKPFRRKVKLYRSTINTTCIKESPSDGSMLRQKGMDLSKIRKNKGLTKLLVLAKREKVKEELRRNQEDLSCKIWNRILSHHGKDSPLLQVGDLVKEFGAANDSIDRAWPKSNDVQVHLHHMVKSKKEISDLSQKHDPFHNIFQDSNGLAGSPGMWYRIDISANNASSSDSNEDSSLGSLIPLSTSLDVAGLKQ